MSSSRSCGKIVSNRFRVQVLEGAGKLASSGCTAVWFWFLLLLFLDAFLLHQVVLKSVHPAHPGAERNETSNPNLPQTEVHEQIITKASRLPNKLIQSIQGTRASTKPKPLKTLKPYNLNKL